MDEIKAKKEGVVRIGWYASGSHLADLPVIKDAIVDLLRKYENIEFYFAGIITADFGGGRFHHVEGTGGYDDFPQFLADMDLDISIAPNKNIQFNDCRTNIKWLEPSMLEIPCVLSDIYPYRTSVKHGETAFLAKTKADWVKYLSLLIESKELREKIGKNAKKEVLEHWTIEKMLPLYEEVFEKVREKNITVYTSISGKFDRLREDQNTEGANFVAFCDGKNALWNTLPTYKEFKNPRRNSRIQKILSHQFIDSEYSIYMDGNFALKVPAKELIDRFLKDKDVAVFKHPGWDCIYEEGSAIVRLKKAPPEAITEQMKHYAKRGVNAHGGLCECGIIIRRNTPEVARMNEKWWSEYCRFSERDQMSFTIAFPLDKVNVIDEWSATSNPFFDYQAHL